MNNEWLLNDDELGNIEVSISFHNWLLSHDLKWTGLIPLWRETCKVQLAKAEPLIRADERKQIGDYLASEIRKRQSLTPKDADYFVAIDWFEVALERLQKGEAVK